MTNKFKLKILGTFRVVTEDSLQFTIDEDCDSDFHQALADDYSFDPIIDQPLIDHFKKKNDCPQKKVNRTTIHSRETSLLTDEVEIDNDSASDELDLLPPLPPYSESNRKFSKWKMQISKWLLCCNPRVPIKCTIM
ncbi:unnamed protein product [Thelazia callipaeda]|uniref:Uncharacterized protein n=1 Tax=Thelazia callipaeda TaxID=103827 RepID=A0A0N5CUW0_THECL|nr:unnamed protein product [Thelazia callipaeda]